ncbi:MAG TPA: hypothetical protein PLP01_04900 [Phycisphaerae bacterium]|nr:hypothetical protein [Phycisphaerae bacterium]HOI54563.1 hypothetical protein [Phycisphaerae bacterium]
MTGEVAIGRYIVRTYLDTEHDGGSWEILADGCRVLAGEGWRFGIGRMWEEPVDEHPERLIGRDINGDGVPEVVLYEWTGGAHCCFVARVVSLGQKCRVLAEIHGRHGVPQFEDRDGDGIMEVCVYDWTFEYWPGCFADCPAPQVVLCWRDGRYVADAALTATAAPPLSQVRAEAERIRLEGWVGDNPPPLLFRTALDLMYGGHEELGWQFIGWAWRADVTPDPDRLSELSELLARSPHWRELQRQRRAAACRPVSIP